MYTSRRCAYVEHILPPQNRAGVFAYGGGSCHDRSSAAPPVSGDAMVSSKMYAVVRWGEQSAQTRAKLPEKKRSCVAVHGRP